MRGAPNQPKMPRAEFIANIKTRMSKIFRSFHDIERDRRFNDDERLELLGCWEAKDDFEKALLAKAMQSIREGKKDAEGN